MNILTLLLVLLLCALLGLRLYLRRSAQRTADGPWPFCAKKPLAGPEQVLYQRLVWALPACTILYRVDLSSVLGVKRGFDAERWARRIRHLHYDFVVCAKDATVLAAIVLQDPSPSTKGRTRSDAIQERASAAAGVRLLRWQTKPLPDVAVIQTAFAELLMPLYEEAASSANQSWWPPITGTNRQPPLP